MVSSDKPKDWVKVCTSALADASTRFSTPGSVNAFSMFDSTPYCAKSNDGDSQDQQDDKVFVNWMKNKDLIFKDYTGSLVLIPEVYVLRCFFFTKGIRLGNQDQSLSKGLSGERPLLNLVKRAKKKKKKRKTLIKIRSQIVLFIFVGQNNLQEIPW